MNLHQAADEAIRRFADTLYQKFASQTPGHEEAQLQGPIEQLLRAAGQTFDLTVVPRNESPVHEVSGRPDFGIDVDGLLCGHLELKKPGAGANTGRYTGHDREQWQRFAGLPNVVYTDGRHWALYRTGERVGSIVDLGDVINGGSEAIRNRAVQNLWQLLRDCFTWEPIVPDNPAKLAELLAPLCRVVRDDVLEALQDPDAAMTRLARDWRQALFPEADNVQFADAYAQTLTYALLLARVEGAEDLRITSASDVLERRHGLLAAALRILGHPRAREEIAGLSILERVISVVDRERLGGPDLWIYFYEHFLASYDRKLRRDRGVYYTPPQVIGCQVRLTDQLLRERLVRRHGFADDDVITLDPGCGTGSYLLRVVEQALEQVEHDRGPAQRRARASVLARNLHGFELLVGPYAVAHLMVTQALREAGAHLPDEGVHVYLTDTLESPYEEEPDRLPLGLVELSDEHRRAIAVKSESRVLVCLGNPPYDRQQIDIDDDSIQRKGGWVRFGEPGSDKPPLLEDFLSPAREAGAGLHLKNIYNDYVYFWRWAMWKVLDTTDGPGIVTFISAASYLRGPGFGGMRQAMRQTFDEMWIIDLEGERRGPRTTENVFAIQTPVAIAVAVRSDHPRTTVPAAAHYTRITGTEEEKLATLDAITRLEDIAWQSCNDDWQAPLIPAGEGDFFAWPALTDLFPWQHSGVQTKRQWVIAPDPHTLRSRWRQLLTAPAQQRAELMRETSARTAMGQYRGVLGRGSPRLTAIDRLPADADPFEPVRYAYRSFDRQWILPDGRLGDRWRPPLWLVDSPSQIYLTSLLHQPLGLGPAAVVAAHIPDLHHFRGSVGGQDVMPLWRDATATVPNVPSQLLERLGDTYGHVVEAEDLLAYCYAILANPSYTERFSEELAIPGPHVPLTRDADLWARAVDLGRHLLWLHTYGERCVPNGRLPGQLPTGRATYTTQIGSEWPQGFEYDPDNLTLRVGDGEFTDIEPAVWAYEVSGYRVAQGWLEYRTGSGSGRSSSPLDSTLPERWSATMLDELIDLLWLIEHTLASQDDLDALLDDIVAGDVITNDELPSPEPHEREAPTGDESMPEPGELTLFAADDAGPWSES